MRRRDRQPKWTGLFFCMKQRYLPLTHTQIHIQACIHTYCYVRSKYTCVGIHTAAATAASSSSSSGRAAQCLSWWGTDSYLFAINVSTGSACVYVFVRSVYTHMCLSVCLSRMPSGFSGADQGGLARVHGDSPSVSRQPNLAHVVVSMRRTGKKTAASLLLFYFPSVLSWIRAPLCFFFFFYLLHGCSYMFVYLNSYWSIIEEGYKGGHQVAFKKIKKISWTIFFGSLIWWVQLST